jgi:hypothetical protein
VLDATDGIEFVTPGAEEVLDLLRHSDRTVESLPSPVRIVAAQTARRGATADAGERAYGTWVGHPPSDRGDCVAIGLERTSEEQAARLRLEAFALSPRETDRRVVPTMESGAQL